MCNELEAIARDNVLDYPMAGEVEFLWYGMFMLFAGLDTEREEKNLEISGRLFIFLLVSKEKTNNLSTLILWFYRSYWDAQYSSDLSDLAIALTAILEHKYGHFVLKDS